MATPTARRAFAGPLALGLAAGIATGIAVAAPAAASEWWVLFVSGAPAVEAPTLSFADGGIAGTTGCNRFHARAEVQEGALVLPGPVASTRMACPGDALNRQEAAILALLEGRIGMAYDPFEDTLTLSRDGATLELARAVPAAGPEIPRPHAGQPAPEGDPPYLGVFGLSGDLNIRTAPSTGADVAGVVPVGTVLRNAGCKDGDGGRWCAVELPTGDLAGWAAAEYLEPADSALRAGQGVFDATGLIPCAKGAGAPMTHCAFGVARGGGGTATVVVTRIDGAGRILSFQDGAFAFADTSEAGGGFETSARRDSDLTLIQVDDERYEIPDGVLFGG